MPMDKMLAERASKHGDFNDHARISQALKNTMEREAGPAKWDQLTNVQREALAMIQHKIARILAGDPNYRDHWDDIAGYATITADRL